MRRHDALRRLPAADQPGKSRRKIPFFGHPTRTPGGAWVLTALSILLLIVFFVIWSEVVGRNWSLVTYGLALIPAVVIIGRHNRTVH